MDIVIPPDYPFNPPKMKFITKSMRFDAMLSMLSSYHPMHALIIHTSSSSSVWHPNVSSVTGAICLDILKDQWSPALTIKTAMLSLQALMVRYGDDHAMVMMMIRMMMMMMMS